jgi:hypothetical protein
MESLYEGLNQTGKVLDKIIYKAFRMLMEKWNMNNGIDGFAEFYATHPRCRYEEQELQEMAKQNMYPDCTVNQLEVTKAMNDSWLQEQYARWFEGNDRFVTICQYHLADEDKLFFNWLIRK